MIDIKGFLIAIIPIALSPGASFTLAASNVSIAGIRSAFPVVLGTGLGILIHGTFVGLGVSGFLINSPFLMNVLQLIGILFLGWLGIKLIINGVTAFRHEARLDNHISGFTEALTLNLFNVKAIILYLTVVPIFAGQELGNYLILSLLHIAVMAMWIYIVGFAIKLAGMAIKLNILSGLVNSIGGVFLLTATCITAINLYS